MKRSITNELLDWKKAYSPKMPLVLQGARQSLKDLCTERIWGGMSVPDLG
jgi:hypothetical protein